MELLCHFTCYCHVKIVSAISLKIQQNSIGKLCKKGPFKSHFESKFLKRANSLILRKIKNSKTAQKLVDLNGPFCYTMIQWKTRRRADAGF